jgi:hypothetical protein
MSIPERISPKQVKCKVKNTRLLVMKTPCFGRSVRDGHFNWIDFDPKDEKTGVNLILLQEIVGEERLFLLERSSDPCLEICMP